MIFLIVVPRYGSYFAISLYQSLTEWANGIKYDKRPVDGTYRLTNTIESVLGVFAKLGAIICEDLKCSTQ